ncbi:DUF5717 family protein [Lachnospiraceae bacterium ZAX-1]
MQKKVQELAEGKFTYEASILMFSAERLEFEIQEEACYEGSFSITGKNEVPLKGIVHSSNVRMVCKNPQFEGNEAEIFFKFHSVGLAEGDVVKGKFSIICNDGEYALSFVATITRRYPESSQGKIKNLFDFANLAQVSFSEAYAIFCSADFETILKKQGVREKTLYGILSKKPVSMQNMEEFLCAVKKKTKVSFMIDKTELEFQNSGQDVVEPIVIQKGQWGYIAIDASVDADFLSLPKKRITREDFVGNTAELKFLIHAEKLHAGWNFARITLQTTYQNVSCEICVHKAKTNIGSALPQRTDAKSQSHHKLKKQKLALTKDYLKFRSGGILTGTWAKSTCEQLDLLIFLEPKNRWYPLFKVQVFLANRQRQEAEWIMNEFKHSAVSRDTPLYGYYLYLCTLMDREPLYVNKLTEQIQEIYHAHQDNPFLLWILLFLDEELNNSKERKMQAIEKHVLLGCHSPLLYLEAYYLIRKDTLLLKKTGPFELRVLHWSAKRGTLTKEIAIQVKNLIPKVKQFYPRWYDVFCKCYDVWQSREMLSQICSYCIKYNRYGQDYISWYEEAIKANLRITGLYEAWLSCAGSKEMQTIPKSVMMYFQYNNRISYKKQAFLYASILKSKETQKMQMNDYQDQMENFVRGQILERHIDENLALLYEEVLTKDRIDAATAAALCNLLYTNKITCLEDAAAYIIIKHSQLKEEQRVPLIHHTAFIHIYSSSYCILFEDTKGNRYASSNFFELKKLMQASHFLKTCLQFTPEQISYLIHYFDGKRTWQTFREEDMKSLHFLMESPSISESYKEELRLQVIEYYYNTYTGESLDRYLLGLKPEELTKEVRGKWIQLLIGRRHYDKGYAMLTAYGSEHVTQGKLISVISYQMERNGYKADRILCCIGFDLFLRGKYNDTILDYLCRNFEGTIKELSALWKVAYEADLNTYMLEERFLIQLLYSNDFAANMDEIFQSYDKAGGKEIVILAYLTFFSYLYFVNGAVVSDDIFLTIEQLLYDGKEINDHCKLAYFKWLSLHVKMTAEQEEVAWRLMKEYMLRGMRFEFYKNLPLKFLREFHLCDKTFFEYHTLNCQKVMICYCDADLDSSVEYEEEEMTPMYEGIFVTEFVLFYGETRYYYIKEENGGVNGETKTEITQSWYLEHDELSDNENDESCYDLINGMMISQMMGDEQTLLKLIEQYMKMEEVAERLFRPL